MKQLLLLFATIIAWPLSAQQRDTRAELNVHGRINEISVSPGGKIWLVTAVGKTYYADNIKSPWHDGPNLGKEDDEYFIGAPHLERINFFDEDRAILSGYISSEKEGSIKDGLYKSRDGGKTWTLSNIGGDSWMYCSFNNAQGQQWMGGLGRELFYTEDFGDTWKIIKMKYKKADRTYSIFMRNSQEGIAGSDGNEILITTDNWKTASNIPTPLDQGIFKRPESGYSDERISKITIWGDYYVVDQYGHICYSKKDEIQWKAFDEKVVDFELDAMNQNLFIVTNDLHVQSGKAPGQFRKIRNERMVTYPLDMKVVNGSLYMIDNAYNVYMVNENEFSYTALYTNDRPIREPDLIRKGDKLWWGTTTMELYLSDNKGKDWFRVKAPDVYVSDLRLVNDSLAILWTGSNNYYFRLGTDTAQKFTPKDPLSGFLDSPIKGFRVESGSRGCFHGFETVVEYELSDTVFKTKNTVRSEYREEKKKPYWNKVSSAQLKRIFEKISADPEHVPSIGEFSITEKDKKNYRDHVDALIKEDGYGNPVNKKNRDFYYSVAEKVDTIGPAIMKAILTRSQSGYSTTRNWFEMTFYTQDNDSLSVTSNAYSMNDEEQRPAHLPWKIEFNGQHLTSLNVELSQYIAAAIPEDFYERELFDNKVLIMQIAHYLNARRGDKE